LAPDSPPSSDHATPTAAFCWRLIGFFKQATDRLLIRRIGGGFMFPHRLIQECLAA
jgi:hypothetical protein